MKRISAEKEISYISNVIEKNIEYYEKLKDKGFLSENILSQLRNLIEDVAILVNNKENGLTLDTHYDNVNPSFNFIKGKKKYKFIIEFHDFLKGTASHYTPSEDGAEKLVSYYFKYICYTKKFLKDEYDIDIIRNIEKFPIYDDKSMKENYDIICSVVEKEQNSNLRYIKGKFYVQKLNTIYSNGDIYYEITLSKATDYMNKFERLTFYSKKYIPDYYSVNLSVIDRDVELNIGKSKIKIINDYRVAIRQCELKNIFKFFGKERSFEESYREYKNLMRYLTETQNTIIELVCFDSEDFDKTILLLKEGADNHYITDMLKLIRSNILKTEKGCNVLRYLLTKMENLVIRDQVAKETNFVFGILYIKMQSGMFDSMPYAMSLYKHNISWFHLIKSVDMANKEDELLYNYIKNNTENKNKLYTPINELDYFDNIPVLIKKFNKKMKSKKSITKNLLKMENDFVFIQSYENETIDIISLLQEKSQNKDESLRNIVDAHFFDYDISDDKVKILNNIFEDGNIAFIYGPAGTGKTKMIELIASAFEDYDKCFLSNTNTSVTNLKTRVGNIEKSYFSTVSNFIRNNKIQFDILFIDECSMISNTDMKKILNENNYKAIIMVGDIFQIESIKYGNWFQLCYSYFNDKTKYDLKDTHRTTDEDLIELWNCIRYDDKKAVNILSNQEYTQPLSKKIFSKTDDDEIILCLNYDGMYGINNINRVMQQSNQNKEYNFGVDTYKVNDPVLFNDCPRFNGFLYNNLKGIIRNIVEDTNSMWFTIEVDENAINRLYKPNDVEVLESENAGKVDIRFEINEYEDKDDDENEFSNIVPFNLSYAISIHKAQGLEYNSVKIVITSNIEDRITKNIFYTAITRAKKKLKVYWSSDSQTKIFENFEKRKNSRDIAILKQKLKQK